MAIKYHGGRGLVYMNTVSAIGSMQLAGAMRAFTLDASRDTVEVTEFGDANKTYVVGLANFQGSAEGFWASDEAILQNAANSAGGVYIALYPSREAMGKWIGGPAFVDFSIRTAVDQAVTQAVNFRARGSWTNSL